MQQDLIVQPHWNLGATLSSAAATMRCAVGQAGIGIKRREGDGITPVGVFPIRNILYRADRIPPPRTRIPITELESSDGWCDAPGDPFYNRPVKFPYAVSAEHMWREDHLYDVAVVLGFNDDPVIDAAGSAIFLHVARPDYEPTQGCVALSLPDLLAILEPLKRGATISIRI